jgi:hypothetical protein
LSRCRSERLTSAGGALSWTVWDLPASTAEQRNGYRSCKYSTLATHRLTMFRARETEEMCESWARVKPGGQTKAFGYFTVAGFALVVLVGLMRMAAREDMHA